MSPELKKVPPQYTFFLESLTTFAQLDTKFPDVQSLCLSGRTMTLRSTRPLTDMSTRHVCRGELSYLAPLGSENVSAPYFKQCFFWGGVLPPRQSNTTPPCPKTEITNILFYILNLWLRIYCSGLRGCDTREKEIVI